MTVSHNSGFAIEFVSKKGSFTRFTKGIFVDGLEKIAEQIDEDFTLGAKETNLFRSCTSYYFNCRGNFVEIGRSSPHSSTRMSVSYLRFVNTTVTDLERIVERYALPFDNEYVTST